MIENWLTASSSTSQSRVIEEPPSHPPTSSSSSCLKEQQQQHLSRCCKEKWSSAETSLPANGVHWNAQIAMQVVALWRVLCHGDLLSWLWPAGCSCPSSTSFLQSPSCWCRWGERNNNQVKEETLPYREMNVEFARVASRAKNMFRELKHKIMIKSAQTTNSWGMQISDHNLSGSLSSFSFRFFIPPLRILGGREDDYDNQSINPALWPHVTFYVPE